MKILKILPIVSLILLTGCHSLMRSRHTAGLESRFEKRAAGQSFSGDNSSHSLDIPCCILCHELLLNGYCIKTNLVSKTGCIQRQQQGYLVSVVVNNSGYEMDVLQSGGRLNYEAPLKPGQIMLLTNIFQSGGAGEEWGPMRTTSIPVAVAVYDGAERTRYFKEHGNCYDWLNYLGYTEHRFVDDTPEIWYVEKLIGLPYDTYTRDANKEGRPVSVRIPPPTRPPPVYENSAK